MNANKQAKVAIVKEIVGKLQSSQALVVSNYKGITVKQFQELRTRLKEKDVEIKVYKNRLFKIAAKEVGVDASIETSLTGSNVFAFGMSDDISPAKIITQFSTEYNIIEIKGGIFEGNVIDAAGVQEIAILPTYEEALNILAKQFISPIRFIGVGFHQLIDGGHLDIKESKEKASIAKVKTEEKVTNEIKKKEGE